MQEKDDDSTLTQLSVAWLGLAVGGEKYQESYYIFQEMADKTTATPLLLNGQAVSYMHQAKYEDAESLLLEALSKVSIIDIQQLATGCDIPLQDNNNPETLVNLVAVSQYLNKAPEVHTHSP